MSPTRRQLLAAAGALALTLASCTTAPPRPPAEAVRLLAPTGTLRIGVYPGSPTSMVKLPSGEVRGVSLELGRELAQRLGVPHQVVEFPRLAAVLDALKAGNVDFTITNATPARAADMNFTAPLIQIELGYLALAGSRVTSIDAVDREGTRIGVSQGSTSQATLTRAFRQAVVVPAPSLKAAADMLAKGEIDAFATNKAILYEMADGLPGARVLAGRWGLENLAIAVPKGREAAMEFVQQFARAAQASGSVARAAQRAGLRGMAERAGH